MSRPSSAQGHTTTSSPSLNTPSQQFQTQAVAIPPPPPTTTALSSSLPSYPPTSSLPSRINTHFPRPTDSPLVTTAFTSAQLPTPGLPYAGTPSSSGRPSSASTGGAHNTANSGPVAAQVSANGTTKLGFGTDSTPTTFETLPTSNNNNMARPEDGEEDLNPTENFNMVVKGVYRSAFPKKRNFAFLKKLGLRSILTLILEDYPDQNKRFMEEHNIRLFQFGVAGNKEPFVDIPEDTICAALSVLLDCRNHPILIHCNKGKHRTGCLVGTLRKIQHWSHTSIFDEYRRFSHPKSRSMDQQFIELFDPTRVDFDEDWLPDWPEIEGMAANKRAWARMKERERQREREKDRAVDLGTVGDGAAGQGEGQDESDGVISRETIPQSSSDRLAPASSLTPLTLAVDVAS